MIFSKFFHSDDDKVILNIIRKVKQQSSTIGLHVYGGWGLGTITFSLNNDPNSYKTEYGKLHIDKISFTSKYVENLNSILLKINSERENKRRKEEYIKQEEESNNEFNKILDRHFEGSLLNLLNISLEKAKEREKYKFHYGDTLRYEPNILYIFPVESSHFNSEKDIFTTLVLDYNKGVIKLNKSYAAYSNHAEYKIKFNVFDKDLLDFKQKFLNEISRRNFEYRQNKKNLTKKLLQYES